MSPVKRLSAVVVLSASALALTSCGSANPGAAARVGDETVSTSQVNQLSQDMCTAFKPQLQQRQQVVPMSYLRTGVVQFLVEAAMARQVAAQYGVQAGPDYASAVSDLTKSAASMPASVRNAYVEVLSASALVSSIGTAAGAAALRQAGTASPTTQEAAQKGDQIFAQWAQDHTVDIDPRYGLALENGQLKPADRGISFATSAQAQGGLGAQGAQPDAAYLATLPPSQKCG